MEGMGLKINMSDYHYMDPTFFFFFPGMLYVWSFEPKPKEEGRSISIWQWDPLLLNWNLKICLQTWWRFQINNSDYHVGPTMEFWVPKPSNHLLKLRTEFLYHHFLTPFHILNWCANIRTNAQNLQLSTSCSSCTCAAKSIHHAKLPCRLLPNDFYLTTVNLFLTLPT